MKALLTIAGILLFVSSTTWSKDAKKFNVKYEPNWESLDSRPLPSWFDEAKIGIMITWGIHSVPCFGSVWFWYWWAIGQNYNGIVDFMKENYPPGFTYADFAPMFTNEFFNPDQWADLFNASGARYIVLNTKHHEGYTLWPSRYSWNWNSRDVGPRRDLTGDLAKSIRKRTNIRFGVYHSLYEFFNPLYLQDAHNGFKTQRFVQEKTMPELYELVNRYKPDIVWSDGHWTAKDTYWNSTHFLAWLYNESPVKDKVVVNDRWGQGDDCKHGGFWNCGDQNFATHLIKHKWENVMTLDGKGWGCRREANASNFRTIEEDLHLLAHTVSCGGNMLMNVPPMPDGKIRVIYEERLRQLGSWLNVNGEAIYGTKPWTYQNDTINSDVWYTSKKGVVYAILLQWPQDNILQLGAPVTINNTRVQLLGYSGDDFKWTPSVSLTGITIYIPDIPIDKIPCQWAWVLKLTSLGNKKPSFDKAETRPPKTTCNKGDYCFYESEKSQKPKINTKP